MFQRKVKKGTQKSKTLTNNSPVTDVNDLIRNDRINVESAILIFDKADALAEIAAKKKSISKEQARTQELIELIEPLLMQYDLTNESTYKNLGEMIRDYEWDERYTQIIYKCNSVRSIIYTILERTRELQQEERALEACEKAKAELLAEIKINMKNEDRVSYEYYFEPTSSSHKSGIDGLLSDFNQKPNDFTNKPYTHAVNTYITCNELSSILNRKENAPAENLNAFKQHLNDKSDTFKKYQDSASVKGLKLIAALFATITVIGIPFAAYLLTTKTKGEKFASQFKETTKKAPRIR